VKVTVPVGVVAPEPEVSLTVTVQVEAWLSGTLAGEQETDVELVLTVIVNVTGVEWDSGVLVPRTVTV